MSHTTRWVLLGAALLLLLGCDGASGQAPAPPELVVLAASSLAEPLREAAEVFQQQHGVKVRLNLAGSQVLRLQVEQGARVDLFASAHRRHLASLEEAGLVQAPQLLAHNELVVAVPADGSSPVRSFADLTRSQRLVVGVPEVPVGLYTQQMLARAGQHLGAAFVEQVQARVVSQEGNARLVRAKVELGEADAAILYRTDALASPRVRALPLPEAVQVRASYWVSRGARPHDPEAAGRFLAFLLSSEGQGILARHGFSEAQP